MSITFDGVGVGELGAEDFLSGAVPVTANAGTMVLSNGSILPLSGVIGNSRCGPP